MIYECKDANLINGFFNHPDIAPFTGLGEDEVADFTPSINNPEFLALINDTLDGMTLLEFKGPGIWEIHSMFMPSCRGRKAIATGIDMLEYMKIHRKAHIIWGQTPIDNKAARWFNRQCGLTSKGFGYQALVGVVEYFTIDLTL